MFAKIYKELSKKNKFLLNISGRDAYSAFVFVIKDLRLIKKIFSDLSFSFNVGTNLKTQKLEKLDDLIKLKGV